MNTEASTPALAPLYPAPPYHYPNARLYALRYPLQTEQIRRLLPPCLIAPPADEGDEQTCALVLARYPDSTLGPYDELYWLIPAQYGEERGHFCPLMYLTSDAGLAAGREIWGFPKKLASIEWTKAGGRSQVLVSRSDTLLLSIRLECTETYDVPENAAAADPSPMYNVRRTPAAGPGYLDETVLTATFPKIAPKKTAIGLANVRLGETGAESLEALAPPDKRVPVAYTLADITVPPVDIAHKIT